jgi:cytochrome c-type biogenesis protein CcmE
MDVNGTHLDDEESADATDATLAGGAGLDLTPREAPTDRRGGSSRRYLAIGGVALLITALGIVLFNGLTNAALFYYNVDEAIAKQDTIGDQRFRMQGNVIDGTIEETDGGVRFVIAYKDAELAVENRGAPPELFDAEIPVILEGQFVGDEFHSDQILIRHDSTYDEENQDRVKAAKEDAEERAGSTG